MQSRSKKVFSLIIVISFLFFKNDSTMKVQAENKEIYPLITMIEQAKAVLSEADSQELSDEEFLEKYVYGKWRFSRRIGKLEGTGGRDEYPNHHTEVDFSDTGVKEIQNVVIEYEGDSVTIVSGLNRNTFSDPCDMYIFGLHCSGFNEVSGPQYDVEYNIPDMDVVNRLYQLEMNLLDLYEDKNWNQVVVFLNDDWADSRISGDVLAGCIYINSSDSDTLYLKFSGLWEMKREEETIDIRDKGNEPDLTEEEKKFLEKHVYGEWDFTRRLYKLKEDDDNFTTQGVKEMIENGELDYYFEYTWDYFGQACYSNSEDVYLYCVNGGKNNVTQPVYHVWGEVDTDNLRLRNIYGEKNEYIQFTESERLIEVTFDLGYDRYKNAAIMAPSIGDHIYINPEDEDTIYLDFCGLWELKRRVK